jgi:hypothetical protein
MDGSRSPQSIRPAEVRIYADAGCRVPQVSILSNKPAFAVGVGKEHEAGMERLIYRRPCGWQVGRPFHWCFSMKPAFEQGSDPCAGVLGDGGGSRAHWTVENRLHWCMDVVFQDDQMRARSGFAAHNLALLKHITLNLIRLDPIKRKGGLKARRLIASTSDDYRAQLLGLT